ncbi:hypothetical protein D3C86_1642720 [compost metagenome]
MRGAQQFDDADPHHQRGVFHHPEYQVQPAGKCHPGGHRQDDPAQILEEAQPQRTAGPAHAERHRQHTATDDLGEVRGGVHAQYDAADTEGADVQADDALERIEQHELDQQRHAAKHVQHPGQRQAGPWQQGPQQAE